MNESTTSVMQKHSIAYCSKVAPAARLSERHRAQSGFAMLELLVAAGLLTTAVSLVATCAVASQRLQRLQQQHTLAVDELSNQLERLTALTPNDVDSTLQQLQPSEWAAERLPGATLTGERVTDEWGDRVELRLQWARAGSPGPLAAVGWLQSPSTVGGES